MNNSVIVLGGGGHAKVVIEILRSTGYDVSYCIAASDDVPYCVGVPVLCGDHHLSRLLDAGHSKLFPGIGSNAVRGRAAEQALKLGYELVNAVSPMASISPSSIIGKGVAIMGGVIVNAESRIEDLAIINTGATVDHDCHVGFSAHVAPQCALAGNVKVGDFAFLGIGTKVIPEIVIGENALVGAGSIIIRDVPPSSKVINRMHQIVSQRG
ncbi:acetyltransferase [Burkholderia lata]|uniref:Acetyltransferase n=1 Tax=Burkholderia lata (strain ATCC 17760 / DSM 23089 / LMG 22485 / NCIMB 9086 / R18194 / 383) TaxID=482957 RepID=A0A6P2JNE2_BURL3|nr:MULTISPECIES: NeuD/PglB/VioB family sugar acetyltransferase [Burkholderia]VWB45755.1 acetyltransferase [Burkholderia lata]